MSKDHMRALASQIEAIARAAGEIALRHFHSLASLPVERKGHLDLVTDADREVEAFLVASLRNAFPDDGIFGEEGGEIAGSSSRVWVIDPIDGTFNFVRGGQNWAISIGLYERRRPVLGTILAPARNILLTGGTLLCARLNGQRLMPPQAFDPTRGVTGIGWHPSIATEDRVALIRFLSDSLGINIRFGGSSALALVDVALGETDGYIALGDSTWDVMAGLPILGGLGLADTLDWEQVGLPDKLRFACGSPDLLDRLAPLLKTMLA